MTSTPNGELNHMPFLKLKNPDTAIRDDSDCKSVKILDYTNYKCVLEKGRTLQLSEVTNFGRGLSPCGTATSQTRCVMCGVTDAAIPTQNKNVCKACDSVPWLLKSPEVVVKFCKGCKNFAVLGDFTDKPGAAKCGKCRLRSRNNYLKSKKSAFVATKKAISSEPAPSQVEQDEVGADIELGETFYESNSLSMLVVTDSHHNSKSKSVKEEDFEETGLLSAFNDDGNSKTNKCMSSILTPLLFLGSGDSPFPNLGSGVSCGSTYNASCNYNTNRAKLNNTGWRLPCMDPSLLSQNQSSAVHLNARGGIPRPSSSLPVPFPAFSSTMKPSPPFTMSPFCTYYLAEASTDIDGKEAAKLSDAGIIASPPVTPQPSFTSPTSSHLVDRWHWDRELNPLMHLVMATESIAPQSPLPFPFPFPSGPIYTQRKRKISGSGGNEDILPGDILSDDILADDILAGDFSVSSSGLELSETKHDKKQRNLGIIIKVNDFAESPKSSCTLNLDWERMEFGGDRENNSTHSDGKEKVSVVLRVEGGAAVETIAGVEGVTRIVSKQIGEGVIEGAVVDGRDLIAMGGRVKETLSVDDLRQKVAETVDRRKAAQPAFNQIRSGNGHGHGHGVSKADLYSAVSGCFQELSRRHSRGTGSSHALPLKAKSASSAALLLPSQPRPPHPPLPHPLAAPLPMSIFAPLVRSVPLSRGSNQLSSSSSLYHAPISIPLSLCVLPSSTSIPPARPEPLHSSSSSLFSPSHNALIEATHYCDDDEVVQLSEGDAYSDKEMKGKANPCKIMSPAGMGKENNCPQSFCGKSTKHLKKSKASLSDSKRRILGAIRMAELGSTDSCTDISSGPNIDVARTALAVSQECSARSSELAFEELEQWYSKWKFVLHPTD